jgi:competence ComEA-like helix-hairpin-helix protein
MSFLGSLSMWIKRSASICAVVLLVVAMGGTWMTSSSADAAPAGQLAVRTEPPSDDEAPNRKPLKKNVAGKLNLNTATEEQLMLLPSVGPSKAERIVTWRKKNGGFKRIADLRRVKGFGYKTFKRLEPWLDVKGDTTLAPK